MSNRENGSEGGSSNNRQGGQSGSSNGRALQRNYPRINPEGRGYGQNNSEERFTAPKPGREPSGYGVGEEQGRSSAFRDREGRPVRRTSAGTQRNTARTQGSSSSRTQGNPSSRTGNGSGRNGSASGGRRKAEVSGGRSPQATGNRNSNRDRDEIEKDPSENHFPLFAIIISCVGIVLILILLIPLGKTLFHTEPVETIQPGSQETPDTLLGERKDLTPLPTKTPETESESEPEETETTTEEAKFDLAAIPIPDYVNVDLIEPNEFSRPQTPLRVVHNIVVHYVGNPNTSAAANAGYFKQLGIPESNPEGHKASSHFIIGLEGEIIMNVPLNEIAYCSNNRNWDTISIECCHPDEEGKFNDATYVSLIKLLTYLCNELELDENDIIRHYDVTGKECPRYYVRNPEAWETLKMDLHTSLEAHPVNDGSWY